MNIKQLMALKAIMATGTTKSAASHLGLSQSGVSRLLTQLESELNLELFERRKGRLIVKPESRNLLVNALQSLNQLERLYDEADDIKKGSLQKQVIKLAVPYTFTSFIIPKLVTQILDHYPNVLVELITGSYSFIEQCVESGKADLGFTRVYNNPRFEYTPVASGTSLCIMPREHPLSRHHTITAELLNGLPLILLGKKSASRKDIDAFFMENKIKPQVIVEAHSVDVACSLVANNLGISIVNSVLLKGGDYSSIVSKPIIDLPRYQYGLITHVGSELNDFESELYAKVGDWMRHLLN